MRLSEGTLLFLAAALAAEFHLPRFLAAMMKKSSIGRVRRVSILLAYASVLFAVSMLSRFSPGPVALAVTLAGLHLLLSIASQAATTPNTAAALIFRVVIPLIVILDAAEWIWLDATGAALAIPEIRGACNWLLLMLLITTPANDAFKILFTRYQFTGESDKKAKPGESEELYKTVPGAGALIGSLERILGALFISMGRFEAIGLVYTAKTIARFKQMEDKHFAEYYLIGTLYSILFLLLAYLLLMGYPQG